MTDHAPGAESRTPHGSRSVPQVGVLPPMAPRGRRAYRRPVPIARLSRPSVVTVTAGVIR
jgi:hypothetical protein